MTTTKEECNVEYSIADDKRLWIGNLDPRINEYHLLKLMQKYGAIKKFDLLFHRIGPLAGQPRGYAFVTYKTKEEAITAKNALHNQLVGDRRISVTWARSVQNEETEKQVSTPQIPALGGTKTSSGTSIQTRIQAIEAKLKMMENRALEDIVINKTVANETPVVSLLMKNSENTGKISKAPRHRVFLNRKSNVGKNRRK